MPPSVSLHLDSQPTSTRLCTHTCLPSSPCDFTHTWRARPLLRVLTCKPPHQGNRAPNDLLPDSNNCLSIPTEACKATSPTRWESCCILSAGLKKVTILNYVIRYPAWGSEKNNRRALQRPGSKPCSTMRAHWVGGIGKTTP